MKKTTILKNSLLLAFGILACGCAFHQGSGLRNEFTVFRALDDVQSLRGFFDPASKGDTGFFSENPKDYIGADGVATGVPTMYKRGWIISPWAPKRGIVDVRNFKEGSIVVCPYTGKPLRIPEDTKYKAVEIVQ